MHRSPLNHETRFIRTLRRYYEPALAWSENHGRTLIAITGGAFLVSVFLASRLGGEFVPQLDEGALLVTTTRLPSASLATVLAGVTQQERILKSFPDVETVVSNTGTSAIPTDPMGTAETDTFVFLKPRSQWTTSSTEAGLVEKMSAELSRQVPDAQYSWTQPIQMRMDDLLSGVRTQLAISIYGDDRSGEPQKTGGLRSRMRCVAFSKCGEGRLQSLRRETHSFSVLEVRLQSILSQENCSACLRRPRLHGLVRVLHGHNRMCVSSHFVGDRSRNH